MTNYIRHIRLCLTAALFAMLFVETSQGGVLGKYTIYERGDEVWFVGEVVDNDESEPQGSESALVRRSIVVASCSASGKCHAQVLKSGSDNRWIPLLTWHNDMPVLLSTDFKSGITMQTSERDVISFAELDDVPDARDVFSRWQLSGGEPPEFLVARNRKSFGVTREVSGGGLGAAMGDIIELELWDVSIGNKESGVNCKTVTFRSRKPIADQTLNLVFGIGF